MSSTAIATTLVIMMLHMASSWVECSPHARVCIILGVDVRDAGFDSTDCGEDGGDEDEDASGISDAGH